MKADDGIEKISRYVVYHSYNITARHNPKELQHQFHLAENLRSQCFNVIHIPCNRLTVQYFNVTSNYLLFCEVSPTFLGPCTPSSRRLFTKEYV